MPVHFNSILNEQNKGSEELQNSILNGILQNDLQNPDDVCVNKDKNKFTITKYIIDINKNEKVGKSVITMMTNEEQKTHEVIDIDLTLLSDKPIKLNFENKLDKSSDSNELDLCQVFRHNFLSKPIVFKFIPIPLFVMGPQSSFIT